jgi:hypothetical protein
MGVPEKKPDRFGTVIAILIALVSVVGAIMAWRVATMLDEAGGADSAGIRALTNNEDVTTRAEIILTEHLNSYIAYLENDSLATAYTALARANTGRTDLDRYASAFQSAANHAQDKIPQSYIDREGHLDRLRDLGEHIAQDARNIDVAPQPHFARGDAERQQAMWMFATVILFGVVLVLLTTAEAIQNWLRYLFLVGGVVLFVIAALVELLVEFLNAFVFK